jgi:hypothetical protein
MHLISILELRVWLHHETFRVPVVPVRAFIMRRADRATERIHVHRETWQRPLRKMYVAEVNIDEEQEQASDMRSSQSHDGALIWA